MLAAVYPNPSSRGRLYSLRGSPEESSDNVIEAVISLFEVNDSTTKLLGIVCHE